MTNLRLIWGATSWIIYPVLKKRVHAESQLDARIELSSAFTYYTLHIYTDMNMNIWINL